MTRAAIYIRVSTDEQRESLDAQERGARQWCERTGASVVAVYRDEGVSGAEWAARAGVQQLRAEERALAATVARLTLALETAPDVPELAARLRSQSDRLRAVRRELATSARPQTPPGLDVAIVEGAARLRDILARDTEAARAALGLLLESRLRVRWEGPRRPVELTGAAVLRAGLTGETLASPEGDGRSLRRVTLHRAA